MIAISYPTCPTCGHDAGTLTDCRDLWHKRAHTCRENSPETPADMSRPTVTGPSLKVGEGSAETPGRAIVDGGPCYDVRRESDGRVRVWLKDGTGQTTWVKLGPADAVKLGDAIGAVGRKALPGTWWVRVCRWADEHPLNVPLG